MLNGISKILTGDVLKALCDMGHGDELVLADANFPGQSVADANGAVFVRLPGIPVSEVLEAIMPLFPLDDTTHPAYVMDLTDADKAAGMEEPPAWADFRRLTGQEMGLIERFAFYERAKKAAVIIQTGEERKFGNLLLVKGCVL